MRISHADREQVAELLRTAAGDGRLDLDELDQRLEATYAAKTFADLWPLTRDLPGGSPTRPPAAAPRRPAPPPRVPGFTGAPGAPGAASTRLSATLSKVDRRGEWVVPPHITASAVLGSVHLDLRDATLTARETLITLTVVMGDVKIVVGADVEVHVEGTGIMGTFAGPSGWIPPDLGPDSPVVRVRGTAVMGSVNVQRKHPRGTLRRKLLGP